MLVDAETGHMGDDESIEREYAWLTGRSVD